jgi:hypothetical protein
MSQAQPRPSNETILGYEPSSGQEGGAVMTLAQEELAEEHMQC